MSAPVPDRYKTDFNDVDEDGLLTTLPGWEGSMLVPSVGVAAELFDGDGNICIGVVERVDGDNGLIFVRPLWDTWVDGVQSTLPLLADALVDAVKREAEGQVTRSSLPGRA